MSDMDPREKRRWVTLGEIIAVAALAVSALGVWISWKASDEKGPTRIVEQRQAIALTLRGTAENDGRDLLITPVESSHALESLTLALAGARPIDIASDGRLNSGSVEAALGRRGAESKDLQSVPVKITARYVEAGADKTASGNYRLSYRWEGGGLFGGRSLRLVGLSRG